MSLFRLIPDRPDVVQDQNRPDEKGTFREWLYITIFQATTTAGKIFDIGLFILILSNINLLMLESVESLAIQHARLFKTLDTVFLVLFSVEYLLRLYCVRSAKRYAASFYGIIDLLAILPSYMEFFYPQWHVFMIVRSFRLLRIFRIFRMVKFLDESRILMFALIRGFRKIVVFLFFVVLLAIFLGSMMYVVEFPHNPGFRSIPQSIYWAIVTITTVGYGDVAPITAVGKVIASFIMILGYSIIAVPTGIMSASVIQEEKRNRGKRCPHCDAAGHTPGAVYCSHCGEKLKPD
ncbi:ion transporter [Niabella drilacis]|uniref:Voltage-gated potassium channel n=1 Tax=Niabella drilacis (strain DSM 25811 / CCM 8410 / CCUG 62505 / LMG 26954 / E90) TaxID=1285928 RepID=A0A1G6PQT6_NIADE|nr:ion transporter [Niabella drilacis]SDC81846.1 voltage-gated potassium channel [Niabella drilacis]